MDKKAPLLPSELAQALDACYTKPDPDSSFAARLESRLRQRHAELSQPATNTRFSWFRQRRPWMQTLRASRALAMLLILLALLTIAGVAYAIGTLSGFIPGFGFVSETAKVSQIESPVTITQDGFTLTIEKAINDEEQFFAKLTISPNPGVDVACSTEISLPDGQVLPYQESNGDYGAADIAWQNFSFKPLPSGVDRLELRFKCYDVPINARFPLELQPVQAEAVVPAQEDKVQPLTATNQGVTMLLKNVALSPEKTVFQVMLYTDQPGDPQEKIQPMDHSVSIHFLDDRWTVQLEDQNGQEYPVKDITPEQELTAYRYRLKTFEVQPLKGDESLILRLVPSSAEGLLLMMGLGQTSFTFDPGPASTVGQSWELDETLPAGNFQLRLKRATRIAPTELVFEFEPIENVKALSLESGPGGGSFEVPSESQNSLTAVIAFEKFPQHPLKISGSLIWFEARGPWEIHWSPKVEP